LTAFICLLIRKWITNGIWSDYFTTAVRTSGKPGDSKGVSILLIPRTEGVITKKMKMGGQWAAGTTWVDFEDVKVPVENLLGKEGEGFKIIMTNFNHVCLRFRLPRLLVLHIQRADK